jgi:hypothetical protein
MIPSASQYLRSFALTMLMPLVAAAAPARPVSFVELKPNQTLHGFRTIAVYEGDTDRPMGARFMHARSGFTLDVLEIQSVPQAFIWVTTFPTSNMGEPHTQEHLLLGKGNKGRAVATLEPMALADSSAFTMQWRTCYSFYTSAGSDVFFDQAERRLDALLHPDYTDEEVRREVRNFGVADSGRDQTLRLEEKGTVYNEMVSSMDQPGYRIYRAANTMVFGDSHPLAFNSGGSPEALRAMTPTDIRAFHRRNYHLANMGMIASLPKDVSLATTLARLDKTLRRIEPVNPKKPVRSERDLPAPRGDAAGSIRLVEYPHRNEQQPGSAWIVWPADRTLDHGGVCVIFSAIATDRQLIVVSRVTALQARELGLDPLGTGVLLRGDKSGIRLGRQHVWPGAGQLPARKPLGPDIGVACEQLLDRRELRLERQRPAKSVAFLKLMQMQDPAAATAAKAECRR